MRSGQKMYEYPEEHRVKLISASAGATSSAGKLIQITAIVMCGIESSLHCMLMEILRSLFL